MAVRIRLDNRDDARRMLAASGPEMLDDVAVVGLKSREIDARDGWPDHSYKPIIPWPF